MLTSQTAADAIYYVMTAEPQAVPIEINIQPDSHLFLMYRRRTLVTSVMQLAAQIF